MSTPNLNLALTLSLNDRLVAPMQRAIKEVEKSIADIEKELEATNAAGEKVGKTLAGMNGPTKATKDAAELARTAERIVPIADRMRAAFDKVGNVIKGINTGIAAAQAAKMVLSEPLAQGRAYERQLADAANIAYAGKSKDERLEGMRGMDASVKSAVRTGGGSRETALQAMNDLFAANIDKGDVEYLLPHIQKYSTAGNADPANIASLVIYGLRSLKLPKEQIPLMLDKTLSSTNVGSMEFDSLAKWMPQIGAAGGAAGITGMKGYEEMLAGVQVSRLTAGTKDEAGTNFRDLLSMINGHALMTAAQRQGIDAAGSIAKHIGGGGSALTGVVALADYFADHDPRYAALQKKLVASGIQRDKKGSPIYTPEQEEIMRQQATLFQGSALGKLFHNQQSMQALVALRNNRDYYKQNLEATGDAKGQVVEGNMALIRETNSSKVARLENEKLFAQTDGLSGLNNALGSLAENTAGVYRQYPGFAQAIEVTKLALYALAAAAVAAGGAMFFQSGLGGKLLRMVGLGGGAAAAEAGAVAATAAGTGAVVTGAGGATAAATGSALAVPGLVVAGGLAASVYATNVMKNNPALREAFTEENDPYGMASAMSGDMGLAAAIMNSTQQNTDRQANIPAAAATPALPPADLAQATTQATEARGRVAANDSAPIDWAAVATAIKAPVDIRLKVDAPEFMSVQQISDQVARAGRRQ